MSIDDDDSRIKDWDHDAILGVCTAEPTAVLCSLVSCSWPWWWTAIGSKLGPFYPFAGRRRAAFFWFALFLVCLHGVTDTVGGVLMAQWRDRNDDSSSSSSTEAHELAYAALYAVMSLATLGMCIISTQLRTRTRQLHAIAGNVLHDALCAFACPCCVVLQMSRQLDVSPSDACTITIAEEGRPDTIATAI